MWLAVLLILDAALLGGLGWATKKDKDKTDEQMREWVAKPVPVKVTSRQVWFTQIRDEFYKKLDQHANPNGYQPKHAYTQL